MKADTLFCNYEKVNELTHQVLFTTGEKADSTSSLSTEKFHSASHSIILTPDNQYSRVIKLPDFQQIMKVQVSVWCYCPEDRKAIIIATCGTGIDFYGNDVESVEPSGWKKLTLNFWMPQGEDVTKCNISFWNTGSGPAYFDDVQIVKIYKD